MSFVVGDILWLRVLAIAAGLSHMVFNTFHPVGRTLWLPIRWNAFYVAVNTVYVGKLLSERIVRLSPEERQVYERYFTRVLGERDFQTLVRLGTWQTTTAREAVIQQGLPNPRLILVLEGPRAQLELPGGSAEQVHERPLLSRLDRSSIFGEASFLHGSLPMATVWLEPGTRYLSWDRQALVDAVGADSPPVHGLELLISRQLSLKLSSTTGVLLEASREAACAPDARARHRLVACAWSMARRPALAAPPPSALASAVLPSAQCLRLRMHVSPSVCASRAQQVGPARDA